MSEPAEQLAFRVPAGTRERIRTVAREGESMTATVLRGLAALEGQSAAHDAEPGQPLADERLADLERRVSLLEGQAPAMESEGQDYPPLARDMALGMRARGCPPAEIRAALVKVCGKSPSAAHLARALRRWAGQD
ncbi:hypothetical protein [Thiobaca trueperi]|uniref:Uncharacterized protein n=1 Tax=Thiobaca trueperi TaxID=127458 RepID=A0A4R3MXV2_9GAMM|nr:hypothetical protein [Thiobaca trueperi]TCT20637.1 hypothetical protein EDC35_10576 [Thiobaca trueperi]